MMKILILMDELVDNILEQVSQLPEKPTELELSIWETGLYRPNDVGRGQFIHLLKSIGKMAGVKKPLPEIILTVSQNMPNSANKTLRVRMTDKMDLRNFCQNEKLPEGAAVETKIKHTKTDIFEYGLRLRISTELPLSDRKAAERLVSDRSTKKTYRHAKRYSILLNSLINVDFSVVRQYEGVDLHTSGVLSSQTPEVYEVEFELVNLTNETKSATSKLLTDLLTLTQGNIFLEPRSQLLAATNEYIKFYHQTFFIPSTQQLKEFTYQSRIDAVKYYIAPDISAITKDYLSSGVMTSQEYYVTDKADGLRMLMFITKTGRCYLIGKGSIKILKRDGYRHTERILNVYPTGLTIPLTLKPTIDLSMNRTGYLWQEFLHSGLSVENTELRDPTEKELTTWGITESEWKADNNKLQRLQFNDLFSSKNDYSSSLLDGEVLKSGQHYWFLAFDLIVLGGVKLCNFSFIERYNIFRGNFSYQDSDVSNIGRSISIHNKRFHLYSEGDNKVSSKFKPFIDGLSYKDGHGNIVPKDSPKLHLIEFSNHPVGQYVLDGLVFQPSRGKESFYPDPSNDFKHIPLWDSVKKFKPRPMDTVDLKLKGQSRVIQHKNPHTGTSTSCVPMEGLYGKRNKVSTYPVFVPYVDGVMRAENLDAVMEGDIVECRLEEANGRYWWTPTKPRYDKAYPNGEYAYDIIINTLTKNMVTFHNLSEVKGGYGATDLPISKVNRCITNHFAYRQALLSVESNKVSVLNLGSGSAKNAMAWVLLAKDHKINVTLRGLDKEPAEINQAIGRIIDRSGFNYNKSLCKYYIPVDNNTYKVASFITPLHQNIDLNMDGWNLSQPGQFDTISCIFAIHHAFASEEAFHQLMENVSRNLRVGGRFVGAYMKGAEVRAKASIGKKTLELNYAGWSIKQVGKWDPDAPFGRKISVALDGLYSNNEEFLIDLDDYRILEIMRQYGLQWEISLHRKFTDFLDEHGTINENSQFIEKARQIYKNITRSNSPESTAQVMWLNLHRTFCLVKINESKVLPRSKKTSDVRTQSEKEKTIRDLQKTIKIPNIDNVSKPSILSTKPTPKQSPLKPLPKLPSLPKK
jgi:SAM-dependent methyltransferase